MSRIRGKDTTPEKIVRSLLHRMGYRFRLHVRIPIPDSLFAPIGERIPRKNISRVEPLKRSCRREEAERVLLASVRLLTSAATRFRGRVRERCRTPRSVSVDILLPKYKTAIFVHGCFWHRHRGCKNCTTPTHRREWWVRKLEGNAERDKVHQRVLAQAPFLRRGDSPVR